MVPEQVVPELFVLDFDRVDKVDDINAMRKYPIWFQSLRLPILKSNFIKFTYNVDGRRTVIIL
jgi:hypothetical protein